MDTDVPIETVAHVPGTYLLSFDPYFLSDPEQYYDHDPTWGNQSVLMPSPRVTDRNDHILPFLSPQAPDPLGLNTETGLVTDLDTGVDLGELTNISVPTVLDESDIETNADAIVDVCTSDGSYEALATGDPRFAHVRIEAAHAYYTIFLYPTEPTITSAPTPITEDVPLGDLTGNTGVVNELARALSYIRSSSVDAEADFIRREMRGVNFAGSDPYYSLAGERSDIVPEVALTPETP
jgi:hypothetical protein